MRNAGFHERHAGFDKSVTTVEIRRMKLSVQHDAAQFTLGGACNQTFQHGTADSLPTPGAADPLTLAAGPFTVADDDPAVAKEAVAACTAMRPI